MELYYALVSYMLIHLSKVKLDLFAINIAIIARFDFK